MSSVGEMEGCFLVFYIMLTVHLGIILDNDQRDAPPSSVALVRKRTIPTERPPPVGEVIANFCGEGCHVVNATDRRGR